MVQTVAQMGADKDAGAAAAPARAASSNIQAYFAELHGKCEGVLKASLDGKNAGVVARSHQFGGELAEWSGQVEQRQEAYLLKVAALEYEFALLALTQGHYRHAFKGLRLVLELCLQAVYLSANELQLREWLDNRADTVWNAIVEAENGVFSKRFARAFFPELENDVQHFGGLARMVYRECSECVHGNTPKSVPLPSSLGFDQGVFDIWNSKADVVALVAHFALAMRYLRELEKDSVAALEGCLTDRVGHITEIRKRLGGPVAG